eukprot:CAMPEP_0118881098 /NCGR_PEP_ID=MMETSP1163-20130328/20594_1 /TAXON_ID=124430 /ORGANISM="Phaeomonas parva, Strain CCMP2877" /LENGTH=38 /DNA_ID= /DNA_START= /DNA_END= /DNA_ORIENTATION=
MAQQAMGAGYSDILFKDILFKASRNPWEPSRRSDIPHP